jgi:hypothetical protein
MPLSGGKHHRLWFLKCTCCRSDLWPPNFLPLCGWCFVCHTGPLHAPLRLTHVHGPAFWLLGLALVVIGLLRR